MVRRSVNQSLSNWTQVSSTDTSSIVFGYTPVVLDTAETLQFRATYLDNFDNTQSKTLFANTANTVLAQPLANLPPTFDESSPLTRSIAKDVVVCGNIGSPVSATDPEGDTLTYLLFEHYSDHFVIDAATGQISLDVDAMLDYESSRTHYMRVVELDGKDRDGNDDSDVVGPDKYDISSLVTVSATSVEEAGIVTLSSNHPEVGESLVAALADPDGSIANLAWQWQIADSNPSDTWNNITGATSDSYTPSLNDSGKYLRMRESYDDEENITPTTDGTQDDQNEGTTPQDTVVEPFRDICRHDQAADLVAHCVLNSFGTGRVELNGSYTIDWGEWDEDHQGVTSYTIVLQQILYKSIYDNGEEVNVNYLSDVYESCEFVAGRWNCERPIKSNYFEDWNGNTLEPQVVVANSHQTQWSSALDSPGLHTAERTFQRWSGDVSDPSNKPVPVTYTTKKFEMRLHHFQAHGVNDRPGVFGINGANGVD